MTTPTPAPTEEALWDLLAAATRVERKFGCDDDGTPSDWTEWADLHAALLAVRPLLPALMPTLAEDAERLFYHMPD